MKRHDRQRFSLENGIIEEDIDTRQNGINYKEEARVSSSYI